MNTWIMDMSWILKRFKNKLNGIALTRMAKNGYREKIWFLFLLSLLLFKFECSACMSLHSMNALRKLFDYCAVCAVHSSNLNNNLLKLWWWWHGTDLLAAYKADGWINLSISMQLKFKIDLEYIEDRYCDYLALWTWFAFFFYSTCRSNSQVIYGSVYQIEIHW